MAANPEGNVPDREEIRVSGHDLNTSADPQRDAEELRLDRTRYVSFWLYFSGDTDVPRGWTLVQQAWQGDRKLPPPFAVFVENPSSGYAADGPLVLRFQVLGKGGVAWPKLFTKTVSRSRWYRFSILLKPSTTPAGRVAIWDGIPTSEPPTWSQSGQWAYPPGHHGSDRIQDQFDIRFGLYRRKAASHIKFVIDDFKFGPTASSVD